MPAEKCKYKTIISIVLAITVLWAATMSALFFLHLKSERDYRANEGLGIYICGVPVTRKNAYDVFGDGTVSYDLGSNMLMFSNATLESDGSAVVFVEKDLTIVLDGNNKFICNGPESSVGVYASDFMLRKDVCFLGGGTLTIENKENADGIVAAIVADDVWLYSNVSISLSAVAEESVGIECGHLYVMEDNVVTVKLDSEGKTNGIFASGNISLLKNSSLDVINTSKAKNSRAIECTGSFMASEGSTLSADLAADDAAIFCHSAFVDYDATVNSTIDAIGGMRNEAN